MKIALNENTPKVLGSSLFPVGKRLRRIAPSGDTVGDVRTIAGPWKGWRGLDGRLVAISPTLVLRIEETPELRSTENV